MEKFDVTNPRNDLSPDWLREKFGYDPEKGRLTKAKSGKPIGWLHRTGYRYVTILGHHYKEHRLIWLHVYGEWPKDQLDHIDGVRSNNRVDNLRDVDGSRNQWNKSGPNSNNSTGFLGVHFDARCKRFAAGIKVRGRRAHLGYFDTPQAASDAYQDAKVRLRTNA